jgi:hypothetical protein
MSSYAEEQMTIEQLMNEANRKAAEEAIIAKAEIDIKPLQDALDALSKKNDDAAKKAAFAGESLATLRTKADAYNTKLQEYTTNLNNTMFKYLTDVNFKNTKEYQAALTALDELGKKLGIKTPAKDVLSDLTNALKNGINAQQVNLYASTIKQGQMKWTKDMPFNPTEAGITGLATKKNDQGITVLDDPSKEKVVTQGNLNTDDVFVWGNRYYRVKNAKWTTDPNTMQKVLYSADVVAGDVVKKAMGGAIRKYGNGSNGGVWGPGTATSDSIPAMLSNGAYVLNAAATQKFGIPLLDQMNDSYNIPTGTRTMGANIINSPSSNNIYNIDIDLNGTTVTADDVLNSFKRELALINAKEGISRRVGA